MMTNQKDKDKTEPSWHRELVRVIGLDEVLLANSWKKSTSTYSIMWRRYGGRIYVQAYVLKQKAVSKRGKYADLRYNKHSPDFDESRYVQNQKYWKYLYPIWLQGQPVDDRELGFLPHVTEEEPVTSINLYRLAKFMERNMTLLAQSRREWVYQSNNHHDFNHTNNRFTYPHHPNFINVDHRQCKRSINKIDPNCGVCNPARSRRQRSKRCVETLERLAKLFSCVSQLAHATGIRSIQKMKPDMTDEAVEYAWRSRVTSDYSMFWDIDDFVDTVQKEMFADVYHHVCAIKDRFSAKLIGRPTQKRQHFYHDPNVYEHIHAMLCCRLSKFVRVKFHSLPECMMRETCAPFKDSQQHRLLPLSANIKTIEKCMALCSMRVSMTFKDRIAQDRRIARVNVYNERKFARAEKRINDPRCWINYPINMAKFRHCGHVEAANEIERFSSHCGLSKFYTMEEGEASAKLEAVN